MKLKALALILNLALGLLAAPLPGEAQKKAGKVHRIAMVHPVIPVADMTETGHFGYRWIFSELRRQGYVEGENLVVERRSAEGRPARFPELARELVRLQPDLILASSGRLVRALKATTTTIPIVGITASPIASGIVSNLARPGGNITGFSATPGYEIYGKQLAFLREAVPTVSRVAYLIPQGLWESRYGRVMREAASRLGLTLVRALLHDPIQEPEYRRVFAAMVQDRVEALVVGDSPENLQHRRVIVGLAAQARLPAIYPFAPYVEAGGLMAYAVDLEAVVRGMAGYVGRILKGADPGELPYQQPTEFKLIVNLKTAKALGLTIPDSLLFQADKVIK